MKARWIPAGVAVAMFSIASLAATDSSRGGGVRYRDVTLPAGTLIPVVLDTYVASDTSRVESPVRAHVQRAVAVNGVVVIPAGSALAGHVTHADRGGRVNGRANVAFRFHQLVPVCTPAVYDELCSSESRDKLAQLMSQYLDSRHLRLVAEVARTESVTRAADRLNVTQSAVSHQLRQLEDQLGTPIFVRSGRRMLLTPAGRLLVDAAGQVLGAIGQVEEKVSRLARNIAGELRVAAHCHTGYHWLPALVDGLRRRYPQFEVRISPEHTLDPIGALLDARLDLAITNDESDDRRLRFRDLFDDEQVAVVSPAHAWATSPFVAPEALVTEQLYLYSRSIDDSFIARKVLRPAGIELRRVTYLQLTEGILEMVKAGMGVSVLPKWSIASAIASGDVRAIRITKNGVCRKWYAATLSGLAPTPFMEEFIRLLIKQGPTAKRVTRRRHPLAS